MPTIRYLLCAALIGFTNTTTANDAATENQPDVAFGDGFSLRYEGGIRLQAGSFGSSRVAYTPGAMAIDDAGTSVWVAGHAHHFSVGRFTLPDPVKSRVISDLPLAPNADPFVRLTPPLQGDDNPPNRITGLDQLGDKLLVNVAVFYDGAGKNQQTTVVLDNAYDLSATDQHGYYSLEGSARAAGWMAPLPERLRETFGGDYIAGYASNLPIVSRLSMGPSLFIWNTSALDQLNDVQRTIPTQAALGYSSRHPLHPDPENESRDNRLWTFVSEAHYGFIPPGTNQYLVVGRSGGHHSGVGYKITQDSGRRCGGYCPFQTADMDNYFWLYDLQDLLPVSEARNPLHDQRPTHFGELPIFAAGSLIAGADFHRKSGKLFLLITDADPLQNRYERQPIILIYSLYKALWQESGNNHPVLLTQDEEAQAAELSHERQTDVPPQGSAVAPQPHLMPLQEPSAIVPPMMRPQSQWPRSQRQEEQH